MHSANFLHESVICGRTLRIDFGDDDVLLACAVDLAPMNPILEQFRFKRLHPLRDASLRDPPQDEVLDSW